MADFPAVIELSSLDGSDGFQINGEGANDYAIYSVTSAGDVNGDGIDDFMIGAGTGDINGLINAGAAYIVFGKDTGVAGAFPAEFNLSSLDGTNGFRISGSKQSDYVGYALDTGDFNGDGISDILIGAWKADSTADNNSGAAFVVFGRNTATDGAFAADVNVSTLTGATGFKINGAAADNRAGIDVSSAGDVNGDGIDDMLIGATFADTNGRTDSGAAYVVFGRAVGNASPIDLSTLDGTNGFRLNGQTANQGIGASIAGAGDINGDGVADIMIGVPSSSAGGVSSGGSTYVVFGKNTSVAGAFAATVDITTLDGTTGLRIDGSDFGAQSGGAVSAAGDINGDGIDDLIIGQAQGYGNGAAFVVFGRTTGFSSTLALSSLNGVNGFRISGAAALDRLGWSVSEAGDVNGDGVDDLIVGAFGVDPGGRSYAGASYVIFGRNVAVTGAFGATLNVSTLNGSNGFMIAGELVQDRNGIFVGAAGDVNNDGVGDVIVSSRGADPNGRSGSGASYIVYGIPPPAPPVVQTAAPAGETLTGDTGNDVLTGNIGKDTLYGLAGDDTLDGGDNNDLIYGGAGGDLVRGGDGGDTIYGGDGADDVDGGTGADKLYGDAGDDIIVGALGNDYIYGGADHDTISGAGGNDYMDGGTGADDMAGGIGNDVYIVDNVGDTATENVGEGYDILRNSISWALNANVEALQLQGTGNIDGTGNVLGNNMQGNAGNNRLSGLAGVDTINGNDGDDVIVGGLNNDLLRGGIGADTFAVLDESINTAILETDVVYDFSTAEGDLLDLSAIDANTLLDGNQDFVLVTSFSNVGGQMSMTFSGGQTLIRLDVDGDNAADYQLKINGDVTGSSADWLL